MRAYLMYQYRGPLGDNASPDDIDANIQKAAEIGDCISRHFPSLEVFIPHTADILHPYNLAWKSGLCTTDEILNVCCKIVEECDVAICVGNITEGMERELAVCEEHGIPVAYLEQWPDEYWIEKIAMAIYM